MFGITVFILIFMAEQKNRQNIKAMGGENFGSLYEFKLCSDRISMKNEALNSYVELPYKSLYGILESRLYIIIYFTETQIGVIRKSDMEKPEEIFLFLKSVIGRKYRTLGI